MSASLKEKTKLLARKLRNLLLETLSEKEIWDITSADRLLQLPEHRQVTRESADH